MTDQGGFQPGPQDQNYILCRHLLLLVLPFSAVPPVITVRYQEIQIAVALSFAVILSFAFQARYLVQFLL